MTPAVLPAYTLGNAVTCLDRLGGNDSLVVDFAGVEAAIAN
jgi:hypothetical protein